MLTPPCHICKSADEVICYPDDHSETVCPDCCPKAVHTNGETGHEFQYERGNRQWECIHCGIPRDCTDYD